MSALRILISTGEASGDAVGGKLLQEMRSLGFSGQAFAVGSTKLREAGATLIADSSTWGALGIYQAVKKAPRLIAGGLRVLRWVKQNKPDLVIAIDFGFLNIRVCKRAKSVGLKTFYFLPPGSWRRDRVGEDLPHICDAIATQFPWSAEMLAKRGANVEWVGHPVTQMAGEAAPVGDRKVLAVLPGSRPHEIELNLPVMAQAVELLNANGKLAGLEVRIACAPNADLNWVKALWKKHTSVHADAVQTGAIATLRESRAAIVCSGTATLEAAICATPMVVVYVLDRLMVAEAKLVRLKFDFISQPSILLNREVVPELFYVNATAQRIAEELTPLLDDNADMRQKQLADFEEIKELLGPKDAITRAARMALNLLN